MIEWKIYYSGGATYTNEDGPPELAPVTNVLAVAYYNIDNNRCIWSEKDFYWYDSEPPANHVSITRGGRPQWFGGDIYGFTQYLYRPGFKIIKVGKVIDDGLWRQAVSWIVNDLPIALDYKVPLPK